MPGCASYGWIPIKERKEDKHVQENSPDVIPHRPAFFNGRLHARSATHLQECRKSSKSGGEHPAGLSSGKSTVLIPKLEIHSILEIEE